MSVQVSLVAQMNQEAGSECSRGSLFLSANVMASELGKKGVLEGNQIFLFIAYVCFFVAPLQMSRQ